MWGLAKDLASPEGFALGDGAFGFSGGLDACHQGENGGSVLVLREVLPAGERRQNHELWRCVVACGDELSLAPGLAFGGAIEPSALEGFKVEERFEEVGTRPVGDLGDEAFLDSVREKVAEALDLSGGLVAHQDALIAAAPDLFLPAVHPPDLLGEVAVEVGHEGGELVVVARSQEQVVVVRQGHRELHLHREALLGPAKDAEEDLVEDRSWTEEQAAVEGAGGDFDQVSRGVESEASHALDRRKPGRRSDV